MLANKLSLFEREPIFERVSLQALSSRGQKYAALVR
jgi:hypothetical protein